MRFAAFVLILTGGACMVIAGSMVHAMVQVLVTNASLRNSVDDSFRIAFFLFGTGIIALVLAIVTFIASMMDEIAARVKALEEQQNNQSS